MTTTHHNYLQIFEELNEKLNADDTEMVNKYILNLLEIKKQIHGLIENAVEKFNKLRFVAPVNQMDIVKTLTQNCNALQKDVQKMKTELNEIHKKIYNNT